MPKVSVIIPVYNSEPYLRDCLDSVIGQTLRDIEVLCVDDGSTDGSSSILRSYAERDERVHVFRQENAGAGAARNYGLAKARGDYLSFLDSDDFFKPTMLEEVYNKCTLDGADICFYKSRLYDNKTGKLSAARWMLKTELLPKNSSFNPANLGDNIFFFTTPVPWDRLFRKNFIIQKGLKFQTIKRANDLFFTYLALVRAHRITVLNTSFVNHRVGIQTNLQSTNHETPLDFYKALVALKTELIRIGEYNRLERAFINEIIRHCLYNLRTLNEYNAFTNLYVRIQNDIFNEIGKDNLEKPYFLTDDFHEEYQKIRSQSPQAYLFEKYLGLQAELSNNRHILKSAKMIRRMKESFSHKIDRFITAIH